MRKLLWMVAWLSFSQLLVGCAANMALQRHQEHQARYRDAAVLERGAARADVVLRLGHPIASATRQDGTVLDVYRFDPNMPNRAPSPWPAIGHLSLSVMSFGLWELAGMPIESALGDRPLTHLLFYDAGGKLANFSSMKEWRPASVGAPERSRCERDALLAATAVTTPAANENPIKQIGDRLRVDRSRDDTYHDAILRCVMQHYAAQKGESP